MEEIKEKMFQLFSYKLQAIVGYKNSDSFILELIDYLFVRLDIISKQNERYSKAQDSYTYDIANALASSSETSRGAVDKLVLNLELFVKRNMVCLNLLSESRYRSLEEKGNQSDISCQKELWNKFEYCLSPFCSKHPQFTPRKDILQCHIGIVTGIRNQHAHQGTAGKTGTSEGYRFVRGYDILLGYLLYSFLIMVIEINNGQYQLGKKVKREAMPQAVDFGRIGKERNLRHFQHLICDYLLNRKMELIFPVCNKNPYKDKNKYNLGKDLTETFFGRSQLINDIGIDKLHRIFYEIFEKEGASPITTFQEFIEFINRYVCHFLQEIGINFRENTFPTDTLMVAYKGKRFTRYYIPFDGNNYGASILKLADGLIKEPECHKACLSNFLIAPELIYTMLIYTYMVEILLDAKNKNSIFTNKY